MNKPSPEGYGNQRELAELLGVSQAAVSGATYKGRISRDERGLYHLETAQRDFFLSVDTKTYTNRDTAIMEKAMEMQSAEVKAMQPKQGHLKKAEKLLQHGGQIPQELEHKLETGTANVHEARLVSAIYDARTAKLKYEEKKRELIPEIEIKQTWEKIGHAIRSHILSRAVRLADNLATIQGDNASERRQRIQEILKEDAKETLEELSRFTLDNIE